MSRTVHLIVYNSPLFPAHWGLWVPQKDGDQNIGKLIHATGDARNGFEVAFKRNYDLGATSRSYQLLPLAQVADQHVVDVKGDGRTGTDTTVHDYLEQVALSIPAPGRSLRSATSQGSRQRVDIQNCQTWLRVVVTALVQNGVMAERALQVVDNAPRN
ncbi:hypothetical protein EJ05DRAFT_505899 [Pseudovirgaria hyperparasitica]|uniref:Uncharacterized protein n=1 Tax=Pseudovirgaria hyperparasitica TaxID=470096 RepID=A0A6A6VTL4_9PEZI|nr:uncharacterized protein EJ05DRAFT_505899 [Pseudovirgaria hyperparasitica]KAF2752611.1 hypothetical protein EJ05DRAFT_505899 [Pseudovirgaria hyperparasitica]